MRLGFRREILVIFSLRELGFCVISAERLQSVHQEVQLEVNLQDEPSDDFFFFFL